MAKSVILNLEVPGTLIGDSKATQEAVNKIVTSQSFVDAFSALNGELLKPVPQAKPKCGVSCTVDSGGKVSCTVSCSIEF